MENGIEVNLRAISSLESPHYELFFYGRFHSIPKWNFKHHFAMLVGFDILIIMLNACIIVLAKGGR